MTQPAVVAGHGRGRRVAFWVALAMLLAACVETGAYAVEWASSRVFDEPIRRRAEILREQTERITQLLDSTQDRRQVIDSALGWRYHQDYASATDHISPQGLRGRRVYDSVPGPGVTRVAAFGDSFVYGNEVADADAWCAQLEAADARFEVLNYGVGGYGLDQAYLRFRREGMALHPHVVLIGFTPDDLRRIVNVYRRFLSTLEWPLAKPRFILRPDSSLELVPNPLPTRDDYARLVAEPESVRRMGAWDQWYRPPVYENPLYDVLASVRVGQAVWSRLGRRYFDGDRLMRGGVFREHSPAFALQVAILRAFARDAEATGARPVVVMLPDRGSLEAARAGRTPSYAPLSRVLAAAGLTVWDGEAGLRDRPVASLFAAGGHYSPEGNGAVASWLASKLTSLPGAVSRPAR